MKPRLFILSFSPLTMDGRVLRQIQALAPHFEVTAAGLENDPSALLPGVPFRFVRLHRTRTAAGKVLRMASHLPGAIFPAADFWPWSITSEYRMAREALFAEPYDLMLCNDLNAVLLGVEGLRRKGIPFVADYHEFPGGEASEFLSYRFLIGPHGKRCLRRYGPLAAASMTVNEKFREVFLRDYGISSLVVLNAPELRPLPAITRPADDCLRVVYHGVGGANRNIELMMEAVGLAKRDIRLHLMLILDDNGMNYLRSEAERLAPGRVVFEKPVAPAEIAAAVSRYDIGLTLPVNHSFNNEQALPNKLFEYVHGGLAVCCSRSAALEGFINEHHNGWLLDELSSRQLAALLDGITDTELAERKKASLAIRELFHAGRETSRMVELLRSVVRTPANTPQVKQP